MSYIRLNDYKPTQFVQYRYDLSGVSRPAVAVAQMSSHTPHVAHTPIAVAPVAQPSAPTSSTCSLGGGGCSEVAYLMDPKYNLREVAKQLILLEDHLFQTEKRCLDCISKHSMTIEGLLEEAITLDKKQEHSTEINHLLQNIKPLTTKIIKDMKTGTATPSSYAECAQQLRSLRKPICQRYTILNK